MNISLLTKIGITFLVCYGIYFEASGWFSAFDTGGGLDRCELVLRALPANEKDIFAKHGMTLYKSGAYWRGKTIDLVFYIKEKECSIPSEIDAFVRSLEDSIGHSRVSLEIRQAPLGQKTDAWEPTVLLKGKMYFWWRLFY